MLTVKEINEVSFGKAGFSGYKPEDVDNFIDEVAESFSELLSQRDDALKQAQELAVKNGELQEKLSILAQKIESYREEEDGIKDVLISAQKVAKESVQSAKDKAEIMLQDAQASAKQIIDDAKVEASHAAREYMAQADEKREELEALKSQVSAFRSSLMEMYKKHLELINHIPSFKTKETEDAAPVHEPEPSAQAAQPIREPAPVKESEPAPAPAKPEPVQESVPTEPARRAAPEKQRTIHDRVDYTREEPLEEDGLPSEDDLSDVGIDLKTYSSIPETLRREKNSHFSNLEFGDGVDVSGKKRKNK